MEYGPLWTPLAPYGLLLALIYPYGPLLFFDLSVWHPSCNPVWAPMDLKYEFVRVECVRCPAAETT